jgi:hypothetical protein
MIDFPQLGRISQGTQVTVNSPLPGPAETESFTGFISSAHPGRRRTIQNDGLIPRLMPEIGKYVLISGINMGQKPAHGRCAVTNAPSNCLGGRAWEG